jgi:hypothetical protein
MNETKMNEEIKPVISYGILLNNKLLRHSHTTMGIAQYFASEHGGHVVQVEIRPVSKSVEENPRPNYGIVYDQEQVINVLERANAKLKEELEYVRNISNDKVHGDIIGEKNKAIERLKAENTDLIAHQKVIQFKDEEIEKLSATVKRLNSHLDQAFKDIKAEHEDSIRKCLSEGGKGKNDYVDGRIWGTTQCVKHIEYHRKLALTQSEDKGEEPFRCVCGTENSDRETAKKHEDQCPAYQNGLRRLGR